MVKTILKNVDRQFQPNYFELVKESEGIVDGFHLLTVTSKEDIEKPKNIFESIGNIFKKEEPKTQKISVPEGYFIKEQMDDGGIISGLILPKSVSTLKAGCEFYAPLVLAKNSRQPIVNRDKKTLLHLEKELIESADFHAYEESVGKKIEHLNVINEPPTQKREKEGEN